jgi:hypothetical protein
MSRDLRRRRSEPRAEARLDQLVAALGHARPVLDDVARARVAALVEANRHADRPVRRPVLRPGWVIGAAAAAVLALAVAVRVTEPAAVAPLEPVVVGGELPDGAILSAPSGTAVRAQIAGAQITMRGPGWATRRGPRIVAQAEALTVEQAASGDPVELEIRRATVRVRHATVYLSGQQLLRVEVVRGEIELRCAGDAVEHAVSAGQSASCGAEDAVARAEPVLRPPVPARDESPPTALTSDARGPSSPAIGAGSAARPPAIAAGPRRATVAVERLPRSPALAPDRGASPPAAEPPGVERSPDAGSAVAPPAGVPPAAPAAPATLPAPAPGLERVAPAVDTAARYAAIERLMVRDPAAARAALRALVADAPASPEAASALLDLARLAAAAADDAAARAALDQLDRHPDAAALAMPARYLRCTMEQTDPGRRACLAGFRAAFPDSPRDAEVLARLAIVTARDGDCRAALPLLAEYRRRYPGGPSALDVRAWTVHCQAAAAP